VKAETAHPPVEEIPSQRAADGPERDLLPRDFRFLEEAHLQAFGPGAELQVQQARAEHHVDLRDLRQADDRVERAELDARVGFLESLARRARAQRLAVLEETRGQRPQSKPRLDRALAQQHAVLPFGQAPDDDLGILIMDRAAPLAYVARQRVVGRHAKGKI